MTTLRLGDSRDILKTLPDNSIDSIVTDPPYSLVSIVERFGKPGAAPATGDVYKRASRGFMGQTWDTGDVVHSVEFWQECLRVLKPGGHLVAFAATRTYHRLAVAVEDAGFEIRDMLSWLYGSGFPKSKAFLKPACEPIVLARKFMIGTLEQNMRVFGTGAINIDLCRVPLNGDYKAKPNGRPSLTGLADGYNPAIANQADTRDRFPANVLHDGSPEVLAHFPITKSGSNTVKRVSAKGGVTSASIGAESREAGTPMIFYGDEGSAARFFYCAKASGEDRKDNAHPTVKPTPVMQWLTRLVTPAGGTVLDPFTGSGSTGVACQREGFQFIGIERNAAYFEIAAKRLGIWQTFDLFRP